MGAGQTLLLSFQGTGTFTGIDAIAPAPGPPASNSGSATAGQGAVRSLIAPPGASFS